MRAKETNEAGCMTKTSFVAARPSRTNVCRYQLINAMSCMTAKQSITVLIIYMQNVLRFDWLRARELIPKRVQKSEISAEWMVEN